MLSASRPTTLERLSTFENEASRGIEGIFKRMSARLTGRAGEKACEQRKQKPSTREWYIVRC
jgi:hypothetical protein